MKSKKHILVVGDSHTQLLTVKKTIALLLKKAQKNPGVNKAGKSPSNKNTDWQSTKARMNHLLDQLIFESMLSGEARQLAKFIHAPDDLLSAFSTLASGLIEYSCLCLCLFDSQGHVYYVDLKQPLSEKTVDKSLKSLADYMDESDTKKAIEKIFFKGSEKTDTRVKDKILSESIVPLEIHNDRIGYFSFFSTKRNAFQKKSEDIIRLLAQNFSMVFQLMLLNVETKELAITDGLTKLYNKRYFLEILEKEFERAKRFNLDLCITLINIDHFKTLNDTHGPLQGDGVLKGVSEIIKQNIRKTDFPARYDGDAFIIIAPNTKLDEMIEVAERIRRFTELRACKGKKPPLKITISLGVAAMHEDLEDALELLKMANDALYLAQESGRNLVCVANDLE